MSTESRIVDLIKSRRGMSFSKLKECTDLENGTIQYHVKKSDEVARERNSIVHKQACRECPIRRYCSENCIIKLLENQSRRQVVNKRLENKSYTRIADEVGIDRSTVSYHLSLLPDLDENGLQKCISQLSVFES